MITYLVELEMDMALRDEYLAWLREHIVQMQALPGFTAADLFERLDPPPPTGSAVLVARYQLRDLAAWQNYLANHAQRMRAEGVARFGDRVRTGRRLLESL